MRQKMNFLLTTLFLLLAQIGFAQTRQITGTVNESDGFPLPGASVVIKGTTNGTSTDMDGNFNINAKTGDVLEIKFLGFTTKTLTVSTQNNYKVTLESTSTEMEEVVVVAYGTQKKETTVGSNAVIRAEAIQDRPLTNVAKAIEGSAPGVQVSSGTGQPGSGLSIQIRGASSVNLTTGPLYVVDGAIFTGSTSDLNPDDIESINILKDAASTSLYGSAAANGVVMITTKKGKKGKKGTFNFSTTTGVVSKGVKDYRKVGAQDYYELNWYSLRNDYKTNNPTAPIANANAYASTNLKSVLGNNIYNVPNGQIVIDGQLNPNAEMLYNDFDWQKYTERKGIIRTYNLNYSGSSDTSNLYASFGYNNEEGYVIKSDFERLNARVSGDSQVTNWLKLGTNLAATLSNSNQANSSEGSSFVNPFYTTRFMGPIYSPFLYDANGQKVYDEFGNVVYDGVTTRGRGSSAGVGRNVIQETLLNQSKRRTNAINARMFAEFKLTNDLKFTTNVSHDIQDLNFKDYANKEIGDAYGQGSLSVERQNTSSTTFNQIFEYNKKFGKNNVGVIVGHEAFNRKIDYAYTAKYVETIPGIRELSNFLTTTSNIGYNYALARDSYFARANYDYDNKYIVSASIRNDKSSRFDPSKDTGTFWSAGLGWNIHKEAFLENSTFFNVLKLRASYGEVGNDGGLGSNPGYNTDYNLYDLGNYYNGDEGGVYISQIGNKELSWETNKQFDVALDFAVANHRVSGTVEYYQRKTDDLIFAEPIPGSAGVTSIYKNVSDLKNEGFELNLNLGLVKTENFKWDLNINAATIKNEITKMPEGRDKIISGTKQLSVGHSIYEFWLRKWYGVDPTDGAPLFYQDPATADASTTRTIDGVRYTTSQANAEYGYAGTALPDVYGSFSNNFEYKGFYLNTMFTYQIGGKTYDTNYAGLMSGSPQGNALSVDMLNAWTEPGDITNVPAMSSLNTAAVGAASSRWLVDSDYISFRNATFGYNFNKKDLARFGASALKVYASAENIYSWTSRKGLEPNQSFNGTTSYRYTPSRIVSVGVNVSF